MNKKPQTQEAAKALFIKYLQDHRLRKTPERMAILDEIYSRDGHFDIDSLFMDMHSKNYGVSRATLYNTIGLLEESKLVVKYQNGRDMAQYERAFDTKPHEHMICLTCGAIIEISDSRLDRILASASRQTKFEITHHSLYIYGRCKACQGKK